MKSVLAAIAVALSVSMAPECNSQEPADSLRGYFQFDETPLLNCLFTYFPSLFIQHGIELKEFIRSRTFRAIRKTYGDRKATDAIYIRAMQMTENNTAVALFISTIACFDHEMVGLNVPIFNIFFPLTEESREEFTRRVNHLPTSLYADSPETRTGDRDKLQHFFGSACITFVFESRDAAMRVGEFVEKGEEAFIVGGVNDERDLRADMQGQQFGLALAENNRRLPSDFLTTDIAAGVPRRCSEESTTSCPGVW